MDKKKMIITSLTLGIIAASSAAVIGLTNLITKDRIIENERNRISLGLKEIFNNNKASIKNEESLKGYKYVTTSYLVAEEETELGYAFRATGSNAYGKISLLVGFDISTYNFLGVYLVVDEQTYASTLEENYIDPLNNGEDVDVHCGATFGAKLVNDMVLEAKSIVEEMN